MHRHQPTALCTIARARCTAYHMHYSRHGASGAPKILTLAAPMSVTVPLNFPSGRALVARHRGDTVNAGLDPLLGVSSLLCSVHTCSTEPWTCTLASAPSR